MVKEYAGGGILAKGCSIIMVESFHGQIMSVSSITYDIDFSSDYDTMIVDIQSAGGGNGWWRFIYQRTNLQPPLPTTYDVN